jgi:hypothetical protein
VKFFGPYAGTILKSPLSIMDLSEGQEFLNKDFRDDLPPSMLVALGPAEPKPLKTAQEKSSAFDNQLKIFLDPENKKTALHYQMVENGPTKTFNVPNNSVLLISSNFPIKTRRLRFVAKVVARV